MCSTASQFLNMILAVDKVDGCGLSDTVQQSKCCTSHRMKYINYPAEATRQSILVISLMGKCVAMHLKGS